MRVRLIMVQLTENPLLMKLLILTFNGEMIECHKQTTLTDHILIWMIWNSGDAACELDDFNNDNVDYMITPRPHVEEDYSRSI